MSRFAELADAFLAETFDDSPLLASSLGLDGYDDRLDDYSAAAFERRQRRSADWLRRFEALPETDCGSFAERIDRGLLLSVLRGRAVLDDWLVWRRQPDIYLGPGLGSVNALFLHRLKPEPELARAALVRLRSVPEILEHGRRNLRPELAPPIYVDRARRQAQAGARYTREFVAPEISDPALRAELAQAGATAANAYERFAVFLDELLPRAHGAWAIGEERYSRLLREKELLAEDAPALQQRGQREYDRLAEELRRCARAIANSDDWPRVLEQLNLDHPPTPEAMRQTYADWTARAREFLREHDLVSFPPGEACLVEPSPLYQRPVLAVASYSNPPSFSASQLGHFFVPFPPDGVPEAEVQQRLENNSYAAIPTTAVHEAYPGHHWQLVMAKTNPSRVRRTFRTPYFTEGWGLYAEQLMREQGFFTDPKQEMAQYEATLFRAARIIVDIGLHTGQLSFDQAVDFMRTRANLPEPTARAEVGRYCSWPTQAASYLTGCLEILRIRDRYRREIGGSLRSFHDRLASSGGLPIALAEQVALSRPDSAD